MVGSITNQPGQPLIKAHMAGRVVLARSLAHMARHDPSAKSLRRGKDHHVGAILGDCPAQNVDLSHSHVDLRLKKAFQHQNLVSQ